MKIRLFLRRIKGELKWCIFFAKLFKKRKSMNNCLLLIGEPLHGNIGDAAIALAEYKFLNECVNKEILAIPADYIGNHTKAFKLIIKENMPVLFHGGGFIGTLWPLQARDLSRFLKYFSKNRIIVLPQTVFFSNDSKGEQARKEMYNDFLACPNLTICVREKYSYELMKNYFKGVHSILIPDMVPYLTIDKFKDLQLSQNKSGILCCLRSDREKEVNEEFINNIIKRLKDKLSTDIVDYTDTVISCGITEKMREKIVGDKIKQMSNYQCVITDRLHGMVFAAIAETPCIAVACNNYKVKGVYEWIDNNPYIFFVENIEEVTSYIERIKLLGDIKYSNSKTVEGYSKLKKLVLK